MGRPATLARLLILTALACAPAGAGEPPAIRWMTQFGSSVEDQSVRLACDHNGDLFVTGVTYDPTVQGSMDCFLSKYDRAGSPLWLRQFGSPNTDSTFGLALDAAGNVYMGGTTYGDLDGPNLGRSDAFVTRFDAQGNDVWTHQFGTTESDYARRVATDPFGNVYLSGYTRADLAGENNGELDAFVAKFDSHGMLLWSRQIGTPEDECCFATAADSTGVYIGGYTWGNLGGPNTGTTDAWVSRFDADGDWAWTQQFGTGAGDSCNSLSVDGLGNVYAAGYVTGQVADVAHGGRDAFVQKYTMEGDLVWTTQIGSSKSDGGNEILAVGAEAVYLAGATSGHIQQPVNGEPDAFLTKLDPGGGVLWTSQIGGSGSDVGYGLAADEAGRIYMSGYTTSSLAGPNAGAYDAFIVSYVPEPGSITLLVCGALGLLAYGWRRRGR